MLNTSLEKMPKNLQPIWKGTVKALQTLLILAKIIIPVTFVLVALDQSGWLLKVATVFGPFLRIFGLSGTAALPILLGFFLNIYAAMGAIVVLTLSSREITIIAVMILTCHALLMETSILKFTGLPPITSILLRIGVAFFFAFLLNLAYTVLGG